MESKKITIPKTARYFVSGNNSEATQNVWFVLHGYAQLANYFIKNFETLDPDKHLIIAPEGLHRFYWSGFSGRVVASWMTKEDRLDDIQDYINYLSSVYDETINGLKNKNVKVHLLGFSQGGATASRWITSKRVQFDSLILWASVLPEDMDFESDRELFKTFRTFFVVGNDDEFLNKQQIEMHKNNLTLKNIPFSFIEFEGKHEIKADTLMSLSEKI